jgi:imidazolonepropionase-like amidohydrolase
LKTVFENGRLFVGDGKIVDNATAIVEGNKIVDIGRRATTPAGAEVIDCSGKTIMPGLFDCEVHICFAREVRFSPETLEKRAMLAVMHARRTLEAGFTTVRDCGSEPYLNIDLRDVINAGWVPGPRILATGAMRMTGGHGGTFLEADGVDGCRKAARMFLSHNADIIKCMATGGISDATLPTAYTYSVEEMAAAFEEAHKVGKRTAAHAYGPEGIKKAILAGANCIQHGNLLDDECIDLMTKREVFLVPTLALRMLRERHPEIVKTKGYPEASYQKNLDPLKHMRETRNMERAFRAGVKVALGTDWPEEVADHGDNAQEFDGLIELVGMTPMEAIIAATKTGAECCGLEGQLGTIEVGKLADILVVNGDPVENINILKDIQKIQIVMKDGIIFARRGL